MSMRCSVRAPLFAAATTVALLGGLVHVDAQPAIPPSGEGQVLISADVDRIDAAMQRLLALGAGTVEVGEAWAEPSTGNSGTLKVSHGYRLNGDDCHTISWKDLFKNGGQQTFVLDTCLAAGEWKRTS